VKPHSSKPSTEVSVDEDENKCPSILGKFLPDVDGLQMDKGSRPQEEAIDPGRNQMHSRDGEKSGHDDSIVRESYAEEQLTAKMELAAQELSLKDQAYMLTTVFPVDRVPLPAPGIQSFSVTLGVPSNIILL
jgi:hypothetical protein